MTLIFGGAVTGDVVLSIVLIVAGIVLTTPTRTPRWCRRSRAFRRPDNSPNSPRRKPCSRR